MRLACLYPRHRFDPCLDRYGCTMFSVRIDRDLSGQSAERSVRPPFALFVLCFLRQLRWIELLTDGPWKGAFSVLLFFSFQKTSKKFYLLCIHCTCFATGNILHTFLGILYLENFELEDWPILHLGGTEWLEEKENDIDTYLNLKHKSQRNVNSRTLLHQQNLQTITVSRTV